MRIISFLSSLVIACACVSGATAETSEAIYTNSETLNQAITMARNQLSSLDKDGSKVEGYYGFYSGLNIMGVRDVDFVVGIFKKECPIEQLYGLYKALKECVLQPWIVLNRKN